MAGKRKVRAIFEDGVFKPLTPVKLPEKQIVEFELEIYKSEEEDMASFESILAPYWKRMSIEEMEEILNAEKRSRLTNQSDANSAASDTAV
jgi:predicted DNA-binding antitoxin AbrB/MazE fold protein